MGWMGEKVYISLNLGNSIGFIEIWMKKLFIIDQNERFQNKP